MSLRAAHYMAMLAVRSVTGPATALVGEDVTYAASCNQEPSAAAAARVRWLIKTADGGVLAHLVDRGPILRLRIPETWSGHVATVMAYLNAPTANVAVRTAVTDAPRARGARDARSPRTVEVIREGTRYYATTDGEPRFYLGTDVRYGTRRGLMNTSNPPGPRYRPEDFEAAHGDWAWYLNPSITCESRGHFSCLNTYDRAAFTFGHIQLGAHTPNDNFVAFFRQALQQPAAAEYFPDLTIVADRIHRISDGGSIPLESKTTTTALMEYFNASPDCVDDAEASRAARIVDWSIRHAAMRELQVAFTVREQRRKLADHARTLPLQGVSDKLCLVILDVLHQGRAKYPAIKAGLASNDPFDALLNLGASTYHQRIATLRAGIRDLEALGKVGRKVFDAARGDFVDAAEA
jgi:hypothetical protein